MGDALQVISRAYEWILDALKVCAEIVIFLVFVVIVIDITLTILSGFNTSIQPWAMTMGFVEYCLLWFTMLAAPWLARHKGHVYLDVVTVLLPPEVQKVTAKITYVVAFCGSAIFAYYSALLFWEAYVEELIDERGADMYQWILYFPMPIGSGLVAIEFLRYLCGFDNMYDKRTEAIDARGSL